MQITIDTQTMTKQEAICFSEIFINLFPHVLENICAAWGVDELPKSPTAQNINEIRESLTEVIENTILPEAAFGKQNAQGHVDLDKNGFPWDARIHSGNKEKTVKGVWRSRRGVTDETIAQVEAELRAVLGAPEAQVAQVPTPPAPVPAPAPSNAKDAYMALVGRAAQAVAHRKITQEQIAACLAQYQIPSLPMLIHRLDLVPQIAAIIDAMIGGAA